jgi:hypothetical protein
MARSVALRYANGLTTFGLQVSMSEAMLAQFSAPASCRATRAFLRFNAIGRMPYARKKRASPIEEASERKKTPPSKGQSVSRTKRPWLRHEDCLIRERKESGSAIDEIAEALGRTPAAVKVNCLLLGISYRRPRVPRHKPTSTTGTIDARARRQRSNRSASCGTSRCRPRRSRSA